jgi:hypothetical protein
VVTVPKTIAIYTTADAGPLDELAMSRIILASLGDDDERSPSHPPPAWLPPALRKRRERPAAAPSGPPSVREVMERALAVEPDERA